MSISERYIQLILPSLGKVDAVITDGLTTYKFVCPWCTKYVQGKKFREKKCASLMPIEDSFEYNFRCKRSWSCECRSRHGGRSFYNFLAMYNPSLFNQYKHDLTREKKFSKK